MCKNKILSWVSIFACLFVVSNVIYAESITFKMAVDGGYDDCRDQPDYVPGKGTGTPGFEVHRGEVAGETVLFKKPLDPGVPQEFTLDTQVPGVLLSIYPKIACYAGKRSYGCDFGIDVDSLKKHPVFMIKYVEYAHDYCEIIYPS